MLLEQGSRRQVRTLIHWYVLIVLPPYLSRLLLFYDTFPVLFFSLRGKGAVLTCFASFPVG